MRDANEKTRRERRGEDRPGRLAERAAVVLHPGQREKVLRGLRVLARVAIRSYMEEQASPSQAEPEPGAEEED